MRIATWNVNSLNARMPRVEEWIGYAQPDVLCMQETKVADAAFPEMPFAALGYEVAHHGDGRWNGVAIVSKVGMKDVLSGFTSGADEQGSRIVSAICGGVRVYSVYVPNGRLVDSEFYDQKLEWFGELRAHLDSTAKPGDPIAVCGDFNVAPEDIDVWDPAKTAGSTHVTEPERKALREVEQWGLTDGFRTQYDQGGLFSWWDYRAGNFHKHEGMRIDLILLSEALGKRTTFALIDRNARKGKQPSDHAPVFVDVDVD
ncbi:MAG: exodeoxyribonuclease III [Acidimicrobiales bacterium]